MTHTSMEASEEPTEVSQDNQEELNIPTKKVRLYSAKEFRKQLTTNEKLPALTNFLQLIQDETIEQDVIYEYLYNGGNCLELLQLLESNPEVPHTLILEVVHYILLRIHADFPQCQSSAYEACRYLLNAHMNMINKMLGAFSSATERKIALKLLTAIVTFSGSLAKDVLLQTNFNPQNLEVMSKNSRESDCVRTNFVKFVISFLVEGQFPTISVLIDKRGIFPSIFKGLKFDRSELVCMFLVALKNYILENPSINKTTQMKLFNTQAIKSLVDLYNWKGPQGLPRRTGKVSAETTDENAKSTVNEHLHEFLLVLCTSNRYGIVFKDKTLGLVGTQHNQLLVTVLDGLERPWEHSYASELVVQICAACPDLTRTVWGNLKSVLERRATEKWAKAMEFAEVLVKAVGPDAISFCVHDLGVFQVSQAIQFLISPPSILKTLIPEDNNYETNFIKHRVFRLLSIMLSGINRHLKAYKIHCDASNHQTLRNVLNQHIARYFPSPKVLFEAWDYTEDSEYPFGFTPFEQLSLILEILETYRDLGCFDLLLDIGEVNLKDILKKIKEESELLVRATNLFLSIESEAFEVNGELFGLILKVMFRIYSENSIKDVRLSLIDLILNTGLFEGCYDEAEVWIDGITAVRNYTDELGEFIWSIFKLCAKNYNEYTSLICTKDSKKRKIEELNEDITSESFLKTYESSLAIGDTNLSPLLIGLLESLKETEITKSIKAYNQFVYYNLLHMQSDIKQFKTIATKYSEVIDRNVLVYLSSWIDAESEHIAIPKLKGNLSYLSEFSVDFLEKDLNTKLLPEDRNIYLLRTGLFYFTNLIKSGKINENQAENFRKLWKHTETLQLNIKTILKNNLLLESFKPLQTEGKFDFCSNFLVEYVKHCKEKGLQETVEIYLNAYRTKITEMILKLLTKSNKYKNKYEKLLELLEVFELDLIGCRNILIGIKKVELDCFTPENGTPNIVYGILVYTLRKFLLLSTENLQTVGKGVLEKICDCVTFLNEKGINSGSLAKVLKEYLELFEEELGKVKVKIFESVLCMSEFCNDNIELGVFLLRKKKCGRTYIKAIEDHLENICCKKGVVLPILTVLTEMTPKEKLLENIYESFKPSLIKALNKPQKAGRHLENHYKSIKFLLENFMNTEEANTYTNKPQKFEISEPFHCHLLTMIYTKSELNEHNLKNSIITLTNLHLTIYKKKTKTEEDFNKLQQISEIFNDFLINNVKPTNAAPSITTNETFQLFCKYNLKFGLSEKSATLLKTLRIIFEIFDFNEEDSGSFLEMIVSHSEFLEVALNEHTSCKTELLRLFSVITGRHETLMDASHVPMLFGSYRATLCESDRIILELLKRYERESNRTQFYDYKPFLWGPAAAGHYSVRRNAGSAIWRQPKTADVMNILQDAIIQQTLINFPLDLDLYDTKTIIQTPTAVYDLTFLLAVFDQILAPESVIQTYRFPKCGALALTILALSSESTALREAASHVLLRYYQHVEAKTRGKDNFLWLRLIEAICKGAIAATSTEDTVFGKLNSFVGIFFARASLVLADAGDVMYIPICQYLGAKATPNLKGIPEIYTFLHSPDVNHMKYRSFILRLVCDGLKSEIDFDIALRSMVFKLATALYDSHVCDTQTKICVLRIFQNAFRTSPKAVRLLCGSYGFLVWLQGVVRSLPVGNSSELISVIIEVVESLLENWNGASVVGVGLVLRCVLERYFEEVKGEGDLKRLFRCVRRVLRLGGKVLNEVLLERIIRCTKVYRCLYLLKYGCKFFDDSEDDTLQSAVTFLTVEWIRSNRKH